MHIIHNIVLYSLLNNIYIYIQDNNANIIIVNSDIICMYKSFKKILFIIVILYKYIKL